MEKNSAYVAYEEAQKQMEEMQERLKKMRAELIGDVIKSIKHQIKEFDIKPNQLFSAAVLGAYAEEDVILTMGEKIAKTKRDPAPAKYRSPNGETWSGGRGRKPAWVKAIEDAGGNIEDYKI